MNMAGVLIWRGDLETHTQRVHRVKMETEIGVRLLQPRNTTDPQKTPSNLADTVVLDFCLPEREMLHFCC